MEESVEPALQALAAAAALGAAAGGGGGSPENARLAALALRCCWSLCAAADGVSA
jgi:hypothetical protein